MSLRFRLGILLIMPFVLATWGWSGMALLQSEKAEEAPYVVPHQITVASDAPHNLAPVQLTLRNPSRQPLRLLGIDASCGCTVIDAPKTAFVAAGSEIAFTVRGTPPGVGEKHASIRIRTDSPSHPVIHVPVVLMGRELEVPFVTSMPDRLDLKTTRQQPSAHEFSIRTLEPAGTPPWIDIPVASDAKFDVERITVSTEPDKAVPDVVRRSYTFRLNAPAILNEVLHTLRLQFASRPSSGKLRSIPVTYRLVPAVRAVPDELFFRSSEGDGAVKRTIVFQALDDSKAIAIHSHPIEKDWLRVGDVEPGMVGSSFAGRVLVQLVPEQLAGKGEATLRFSTDHPDCPTICVRVHKLGL